MKLKMRFRRYVRHLKSYRIKECPKCGRTLAGLYNKEGQLMMKWCERCGDIWNRRYKKYGK